MEFNAIEAFAQAIAIGLTFGTFLNIVRWVRP